MHRECLRVRGAAYAALMLAVVTTVIGCGDEEEGQHPQLSTVTPTQTATHTPEAATGTPTATPLPSAAGIENLFGSSAQGGGALTIEPLAVIPVYFSTCLGGSGDNCDGGSIVYIGSDPGFKEADSTEATATLFALPDGVEVSLSVIAIDPALSLKFDNGTLTTAGQTLKLGTTPGVHADLEWQLFVPASAPFGEPHEVTLQLTTTTRGFTNSAEFTETVQASSGAAPAGS